MTELPCLSDLTPRRWFNLSVIGIAYLGLMLTLALATAALGYVAGGPLHIDDMVIVVAGGLGITNLAGAWFLFRPVERSIRARKPLGEAAARLRSLPLISGFWGFALVAVFMGGHHLLRHPQLSGQHIMGTQFLYPILLIGVYGLLMGLYIYFLISAFVTFMRRRIAWLEADAGLEPVGHLWRRVTVAIIATSIVPLGLTAVHREVVGLVANWHGMDVGSFLVLDISAALLLIGAVTLYVSQSLTRPVELLLSAMQQVQAGHSDARARVVTDDEIGALATTFNTMADQVTEPAFLPENLGRFVSDSVAEAVLADRGIIRPRVSEATILFTDIEGFTVLCERLPPPMIITLLNEYFTALAEPIRRHGGVITQFQGDAMLVTFNLPVADPEHALSAVNTALEIQELLRRRRFANEIDLRTRIGINTGTVVGGTVGGDDRLGYTVHGDAVNLAQRLEQANKHTRTSILVAERTAVLVGDRLALRPLGTLTVKGRTDSVSVFSPEVEEPANVARPEVMTAKQTGRN